jgi:hypothetical protein
MFSRPTCLATSRLFSSVPPCSVAESVATTPARNVSPVHDTPATGVHNAELEDYIRLRNPHFTDIRVEHATATEGYHTGVRPPRRWYKVTYLADDT